MRVTPSITADNALRNLQKGRTLLARTQEQIASGSVINRPSDDPITTRQLLEMENKLEKGEQYLSNINKGNIWLNMTETALTGMADVISRARKVAANIGNGSTDQTVRDNAVAQLSELKKQLIDLGNTQLGDQYLFAGFKTDTPPFTTADNTYHGTSDDIAVEIDQNSQLAINLTGDSLLKGTGSFGSVDVLSTLDDLITAIGANNATDIKTAAAELDGASSQITNARSAVAGKMLRMESAETMITSNQATLKGIIADTQGVDYVEAAVTLNMQQTAFEAALSATSKITQLSLLDYL